MQKIGDVVDGVLEHVEKLSATFHVIDEAQKKAKLVPDVNVKSTPEHV